VYQKHLSDLEHYMKARHFERMLAELCRAERWAISPRLRIMCGVIVCPLVGGNPRKSESAGALYRVRCALKLPAFTTWLEGEQKQGKTLE
jgi:hypothetical protein